MEKRFYYFDYKKLKYTAVRPIRYILFFSIAFFIGLFVGGVFNKPIYKIVHPNTYETPPNIINLKDTISDFSEQKLINLLITLNVKYPHIVLAQAKHESNNFKSKIFMENDNLFGMKQAYSRINTAIGTQFGHAYYKNWRQSVYDYAFYQSSYLSDLKNENDYLAYLGQSYAEDSTYVSQILYRITTEDLRNFFE